MESLGCTRTSNPSITLLEGRFSQPGLEASPSDSWFQHSALCILCVWPGYGMGGGRGKLFVIFLLLFYSLSLYYFINIHLCIKIQHPDIDCLSSTILFSSLPFGKYHIQVRSAVSCNITTASCLS